MTHHVYIRVNEVKAYISAYEHLWRRRAQIARSQLNDLGRSESSWSVSRDTLLYDLLHFIRVINSLLLRFHTYVRAL